MNASTYAMSDEKAAIDINRAMEILSVRACNTAAVHQHNEEDGCNGSHVRPRTLLGQVIGLTASSPSSREVQRGEHSMVGGQPARKSTRKRRCLVNLKMQSSPCLIGKTRKKTIYGGKFKCATHFGSTEGTRFNLQRF